jgi:hypothetical protein
MARELRGDEKLRYPWASRINDFVPVGRMRRYTLFVAWAGFAVLVVGTIVLAVSQQHVHLGLHIAGSASGVEAVVKAVSAAMMLGSLPFAVYGLVQAVLKNARAPLVYSIGALVPGLLALYLLLVL